MLEFLRRGRVFGLLLGVFLFPNKREAAMQKGGRGNWMMCEIANCPLKKGPRQQHWHIQPSV